MKKKIVSIIFLAGAVLLVSGCGGKVEKGDGNAEKKEVSKESNEIKNDVSGSCQTEKVNIPNYGDPGKRLKNCFVEYPGEPSRQDKSYYIIEDICGQFTQAFMENMLGKKLAKIEPSKISGIYNCFYYLNEKEHILLNLEYLKIENQNKGNESMGRKVEKDAKIPMENSVVYDDKGIVNVVYLVLSPDKFISLRPSSVATTKAVDMVSFAANIAKEIKGYK